MCFEALTCKFTYLTLQSVRIFVSVESIGVQVWALCYFVASLIAEAVGPGLRVNVFDSRQAWWQERGRWLTIH